MAVVGKSYHTLGDEESAPEAETSLHSLGKSNGDSPFTSSSHREQSKLVASGSDSRRGKDGLVEPKISGKGWGRVYKFFSGISAYPKSILFIVGNEFCERFTYYGLRAVLILYLTDHMQYTDNTATALYHAFIMLCYLSPLIGAMIADGFLGKYRTILYLSIVYAAGNLVLAGTSAPLHSFTATQTVPLVGLLLIAFGTGGIKPCVSAFGGDQFGEDQAHLLQRYFSIFYFAINAGSVLSTFLSPYLRANTQCFDADCYLYAFGLPAILMIIAIGVFVAGNRFYVKREPTGNVIAQVFRSIGRSIKVRISNRHTIEKKEHWLYWAEDKYERKFLDDVRDVLRVIVLLLPVPIFWTLFDQTGSRWTLQAKRMDGRLGSAIIEPDQMQVANSILILVFIPFFESVVYPVLRFLRLPMRPLQRMSAGMLFAGLSFVVAAFVQIQLENATNAYPANDISRFRVTNALPNQMNVIMRENHDGGDVVFNQTLAYGESTPFGDFRPGAYRVDASATIQNTPLQVTSVFNFTGRHVDSVVAGYVGNSLSLIKVNHDVSKLGGEEFAVTVLNCLPNVSSIWVNMTYRDTQKRKDFANDFNYTEITQLEPSIREIVNPPAEGWNVTVYDYNTNDTIQSRLMSFLNGAQYTILVLPENENQTAASEYVRLQTVVQPASVHILWQIPQYAILTAGEIMFSITGLEFAYSQAPVSMKSVMQAMWLMTVAIGNLIVVIVAEAEIFSYQVNEFFFYAGMTGVVTFIFVLMAIRYKYVEKQDDSAQATSRAERYTLLDDEKSGAESSS